MLTEKHIKGKRKDLYKNVIDSVVFQSLCVKIDELYDSILRQARNNFATALFNFHLIEILN